MGWHTFHAQLGYTNLNYRGVMSRDQFESGKAKERAIKLSGSE